jgi:hypothetical protein
MAKKAAKKTKKKRKRVAYTKAVKKIAKAMKRPEGSLRQKALALGIGLGHQR